MDKICLTEYSHGAGCGCKIAPKVLEDILSGGIQFNDKNLIVGNSSNDDAAVYDLGTGQALVSTTDFFTPIVNDARTFGRIAAANAISDIYSMGAKPIFSLAILGWPVSKLPIELVKEVMEGAKEICQECSIPLAGGHSIDIPEPVFGLAVNGIAELNNIKKNNSAHNGDLIFMNKKIGTGMLSTALKRKILSESDLNECIEQMCRVNKEGFHLGQLKYIHAMTDITGFGLCGHLLEMVKNSDHCIRLEYAAVPFLNQVKELAAKFIYPDNTMRNWNAFQPFVNGINGESLLTLCDPQTNGGLLVAVDPNFDKEFRSAFPEFIKIAEVKKKEDDFLMQITY